MELNSEERKGEIKQLIIFIGKKDKEWLAGE